MLTWNQRTKIVRLLVDKEHEWTLASIPDKLLIDMLLEQFEETKEKLHEYQDELSKMRMKKV